MYFAFKNYSVLLTLPQFLNSLHLYFLTQTDEFHYHPILPHTCILFVQQKFSSRHDLGVLTCITRWGLVFTCTNSLSGSYYVNITHIFVIIPILVHFHHTHHKILYIATCIIPTTYQRENNANNIQHEVLKCWDNNSRERS